MGEGGCPPKPLTPASKPQKPIADGDEDGQSKGTSSRPPRPKPASALRPTTSRETVSELVKAPIANTTDNRQVGEMLKGRGAFIRPGDMNVGLWSPLQFVVGPDEAAIEDEAGNGQELSPSETVYLGEIMQVTLLPNPNFEFEPKIGVSKRTGNDRSASWSWNVSPKRDGTHSLQARVEVLRLMNGIYYVTEEKTRSVSVTVKVGTLQGLIRALQNAASLGDVLTTLFNSWKGAFVALTALAIAIWGAWSAIRRGNKPTSAR